MIIDSFNTLENNLSSRDKDARMPRAVLIGADDLAHLEAVAKAAKANIVRPLLLGPQERIKKLAADNHLDISKLKILNAESPDDIVSKAAGLIREEQIDLAIIGNIGTSILMTGLFDRSVGFKADKKRISHLAILELESYHKLLMVTDGAVNSEPGLNSKIEITQNAVEVARKLGIAKPKVGLLAAVEVIYPAMPVTMEAAVISKMADKGQIKNCYIDGPISLDVATDQNVAVQKRALSDVSGDADILVAPNIETALGLYKSVVLYAQAKTAGVVVGGKIPLCLSSRCDNADNVFNSILLGCFLAN